MYDHRCKEGIACEPGKFANFITNLCVTPCSTPVEYMNVVSRSCEAFCPIGTVLFNKYECRTFCPAGTYELNRTTAVFTPKTGETNIECMSCPTDKNCKRCLNSTKCTECSDGYYLHQYTGECLKTCGTGYTYQNI